MELQKHQKQEEGYLLGKTGFLKITSRTKLAKIFNCDRKTIYNEIMRGTVEHTRSDLSTVSENNAEYAQNIADERNANRGRTSRIMIDKALARELQRYTEFRGQICRIKA